MKNNFPTIIQLRTLSLLLLLVVALLLFSDKGSSQVLPVSPFEESITGVPSTGNFLLYEQIARISDSQPLESKFSQVRIQSDVPLTIQRYLSDEDAYGGEPLDDGEAVVLVSSSCDTSDTTLIPMVEIAKAENGTILSIDIKLGVSETEAAEMPS